jgi:hypothetical protein
MQAKSCAAIILSLPFALPPSIGRPQPHTRDVPRPRPEVLHYPACERPLPAVQGDVSVYPESAQKRSETAPEQAV